MGNCNCNCADQEEDTKIVLESHVVAPKKNNKLQAKNKFALLDDSQNSELNVMSYQKERNMVVGTSTNGTTGNETIETHDEAPNRNENEGEQIIIKDEEEDQLNEVVCDDAQVIEHVQGQNKVAMELKKIHETKEEVVVEDVVVTDIHMNEFVDTYEGENLNDENEFDGQTHAKDVFKYLNKYKTDFALLQNDIDKFKLSNDFGIHEENKVLVLNYLQKLIRDGKRGKSYLWNEKGLVAEFASQMKIDGKIKEIDFQKIFDENNVGKIVQFTGFVEGRHNANTTAIMFYLINAKFIETIMGDESPFCSINYAQNTSGEKVRAITYIIMSKNKN